MASVEWFDSLEPSDRRRAVSWFANEPEARFGRLYFCERRHPSEVWPAPIAIANNVTVEAGRVAARDRLCTVEERHR